MTFYEKHFQSIDAVMSIALFCLSVIWGERHLEFVEHCLDGVRQSFYYSLGGATLALLGLVITANTILLSIPEQSLIRFHASGNFLKIHQVFIKTSVLLLISSLTLFALLVVDKDVTASGVSNVSSLGSVCRFANYGIVLIGSLSLASVLESVYCINTLGNLLLTKRRDAAVAAVKNQDSDSR